jgi:hypothetical protein
MRVRKAATSIDIQLEPMVEIDAADLALKMLAENGYFAILPAAILATGGLPDALTSVPIVKPPLIEPLYWAVQPNWRVPRSTYNEVERIIYSEWLRLVRAGTWPATWTLDLARLSLPQTG